MKKTNAILISALLVISMALAASAAYETPSQKSIRIKNTRYDPFPVEPGNYFDLWMRVENFGSQDITNFQFRLLPEYPFSLDSNEEALREIGLLKAGEQVQLKFKVRADINAVEGDNPLKYEYTFTGAKWNQAQLNVNVFTQDAVLAISNVEFGKTTIPPGEEVPLTISLENMADSTLKDVDVQLNLITHTGTTVVELPISPIGSSNQKTIRTIEGKATEEIEFNLIVDSTAESDVYKIPVTITYNDLQGTSYTKETIISMLVGSEPDLAVTIDESDANMAGKSGDVIIKLVNKGFSEIKFMYVTLAESDQYEILSPNEVYLGNIDSDDYESAEFKLYVNPGKTNGKMTLPIKIDYKDANNNHYSKQIDLDKRIYSSKEAKTYGLVAGSNRLGWIIVLLIVGLGFYIYRRVKKKKKK